MNPKTEHVNVEKHSTAGAYNSLGYIGNAIRFDSYAVIAESESIADFASYREKQGGIIVFPADASGRNNISDIIKSKCDALGVCAWTTGRYLHRYYKASGGTAYDESSLSIELLNIETDGIIAFAADLCDGFGNNTAIVRLYGCDEILFVKNKSV